MILETWGRKSWLTAQRTRYFKRKVLITSKSLTEAEWHSDKVLVLTIATSGLCFSELAMSSVLENQKYFIYYVAPYIISQL